MDLAIKVIGLICLNYLAILYFVYEDGPWEIFAKIRFFAGINKQLLDANGDIIELESNGSFLAEVLSCHKCFGFWSGLVLGNFAGNIFAIPIVIAIGIWMHE